MRIGYIGGFGHWLCVARELQGKDVPITGIAPAYEGEDLSTVQECDLFPKPPAYGSIAELIAHAKPDIAVVSTRPDHIARALIDLAEAGCDLISEKPLGLTSSELRRIQDAVRANGVHLLPMLSMRTDPVFIKARDLFRSGAIGNACVINTRKSYRYGERPPWFGDRSLYGGTLPWVGIHAVDLIHFITGLTFTSVSARHTNFAHPERPDCEDGCLALFTLSNGGFASASVDLLRPEAAPSHGDDWIRLVGTGGVMEASANQGIVRLISERGEEQIPAETAPVSFYMEFLAQRTSSLAGPDDGFLLTNAVLCARESADQNGTNIPISFRPASSLVTP